MKIGDILIAKPMNQLVIIIDIEKSFMRLEWLRKYWETKYNVKLPKVFDTILVNFPSHNKVYEYPRYKKCIKKPLRQKKYRKHFNISAKVLRPNILRKIKNMAIGDEFFDDDGMMEHEVFDL